VILCGIIVLLALLALSVVWWCVERVAEEDNIDNEPVRDTVDIGGPWTISMLFDFS
jgi:hypothetical protein